MPGHQAHEFILNRVADQNGIERGRGERRQRPADVRLDGHGLECLRGHAFPRGLVVEVEIARLNGVQRLTIGEERLVVVNRACVCVRVCVCERVWRYYKTKSKYKWY